MTLDDFKNIGLLILTPSLLVAIVAWARFKKRDAANTLKLQEEAKKIAAEIIKVNAEATKVNAEAQELRAKSDVLITDGALRIVERLSTDLDDARDEIEKLLVVIADWKTLYEKVKTDFAKEAEILHEKIREAKELMEIKKRHCIDTKSRIIQLQNLLMLKQEGLSQQQLEDFINKLNELINSTPLEIPTNLSS